MSHHDDDDDHDRGLVHDLKVIGERVMERRPALSFLTSAGTTAVLAGSAATAPALSGRFGSTFGSVITVGGSASSSGRGGRTSGGSGSDTTTSTGSTTSTTYVADPTETARLYPTDGANSSGGSTSNILTPSGIVRSDIRSSFISRSTGAGGVKVRIAITVVDVSATCAPLAGYAVYLWHCNGQGIIRSTPLWRRAICAVCRSPMPTDRSPSRRSSLPVTTVAGRIST